MIQQNLDCGREEIGGQFSQATEKTSHDDGNAWMCISGAIEARRSSIILKTLLSMQVVASELWSFPEEKSPISIHNRFADALTIDTANAPSMRGGRGPALQQLMAFDRTRGRMAMQ